MKLDMETQEEEYCPRRKSQRPTHSNSNEFQNNIKEIAIVYTHNTREGCVLAVSVSVLLCAFFLVISK